MIASLKVRYSLEYSTQMNIETFSYADTLYKTRTILFTLLNYIEAKWALYVCAITLLFISW